MVFHPRLRAKNAKLRKAVLWIYFNGDFKVIVDPKTSILTVHKMPIWTLLDHFGAGKKRFLLYGMDSVFNTRLRLYCVVTSYLLVSLADVILLIISWEAAHLFLMTCALKRLWFKMS